MKLVVVNEGIVGSKLASPLYNDRGVMYLNSGKIVTNNVISILQRMYISSVYIEDENTDMVLQEIVPTSIKIKNIKVIKELLNEIKSTEYINDKIVVSIIKDIIANLNISENAVLINNIVSDDEMTSIAIHSLEVLTLSIITGVNKHYSEDKLLKLGMVALLHDIGKLFDSSKNHSKIGYNIIKSNIVFPATVYMSVYYQHENIDGTGLLGIEGSKIHEFSKILYICNSYNKLINSRYSILPHQAIEILSSKASTLFDSKVLKEFIDSIYCYPTGLRVVLNNGIEGVVAMQNKGMTTRPILVVNDVNGYSFCNLIDKDKLTLEIKEVIME